MAPVKASDGGLVLGLVFLVVSGYGLYWVATANSGAKHSIMNVEPVEQAADPTEVIDYSHLPPAAQALFDATLQDANGADGIWESEDPEAVRSLRAHSYVRKDGQLYQYTLGHTDYIGPGISTAALFLLSGIAGLPLVYHGIGKREFSLSS